MRFSRLIAVLASALSFASFASCSPAPAGERVVGEVDGVPFVEMRAERLPELPEARGGAHVMMLGGELTVLGGIGEGFVLEPSIAYLSEGQWHKVPTLYPHHFGFTTLLPDGTVMLGGGCADNFGIGQSWGVEVYDPISHSCKAVGILARKRAGVSAAALPDGRVVVSGNWYAPDDIEIYEPGKGFSRVRESSVPREYPFILPTSSDDVLIVGTQDTTGAPNGGFVDRLRGEAFHEPLLDDWTVFPYPLSPVSSDELRIGEVTYLIPALNRADGHAGIIRVSDGRFSLLETEHPLPMHAPDGDSLFWMHSIQVDRPTRTAWMQSVDKTGRFYAARIGYDPTFEGGKASVKVFVAERPEGFFYYDAALLLPPGDLVQAGGVHHDVSGTFSSDYFGSTAEVWLFHTEPEEVEAVSWGWLIGGFLVAACASAAAVILLRKRRRQSAGSAPEEETGGEASESKLNANLLEQISRLIEEEELYKRKDLRISDLASELASNKTYVSILLNSISGTKFTTLVNGYRVRHAQQLMLEHPDMLLDDVAEQSGFSSRATFFRNFKSHTGLTPGQWLVQAGKQES